MAENDQEEFKTAQAPPPYQFKERPGDPPKAPPPPAAAPQDDTYFKREEVAPRERHPQTEQQKKSRAATGLLQEMNKEITGKATIDIPDDHGRNTKYPNDKEDLDSWYESLADKWRTKANELETYYRSKGYKGFFDPKIKGADLNLRNWLFDQTSGQWNRQIDPNKRLRKPSSKPTGPGDPNNPDSFFGTGREKRSELKDDAPALAMLGGNYMGGEDG